MGIGLTTPMAQHRQKFLRRFFKKWPLFSLREAGLEPD
jgi:hypothetical protein